ncbi:MAG: hypothetical protein JJ891_06675 [Rhizobiaceae bacterium]|jgi:hypothetical protein|nr:hypothetical protein [Rhizobiaceae bacterium]
MRIFWPRRFPKQQANGTAHVETVSRNTNERITVLARQLEESWEEIGGEQFEAAFETFVVDLNEPIEAMEDELADKTIELRTQVQRMMEVAPDLFDKALKNSPHHSGFITSQEENHV